MNKLNQNSELKFAIQSRLLISKLRPEDFEEVLKHMDLIAQLFKDKNNDDFANTRYATEYVFRLDCRKPSKLC